MPSNPPKHFSASHTIALVASMITIVLTFGPGPAQDFMRGYPLIGWAGIAVGLLAFPLILTKRTIQIQNSYANQWSEKVTNLSAHWHAQERALIEKMNNRIQSLSREDWERDLTLLTERIRGWELNGDAYKYLTENVSHTNLPLHFTNILEDSLAQWNRDFREFANPQVITAWENLKQSANSYERTIDEYMWTKGNTEYLEVPREWNHENNALYRLAFTELEVRRKSLQEALGAVHKIQHSLGIELS